VLRLNQGIGPANQTMFKAILCRIEPFCDQIRLIPDWIRVDAWMDAGRTSESRALTLLEALTVSLKARKDA